MGKQTNVRLATMSAVVGALAGGAVVKKVWLDKYHVKKAEVTELETERELLYCWLQIREQGRSLANYFDGESKVAVLGMNRLGRLAIDELGEYAAFGVEAEDFAAVHDHLTVYRLGEDSLPEADVMLVCDIRHIDEKLAALQEVYDGQILTLKEALNRIAEELTS